MTITPVVPVGALRSALAPRPDLSAHRFQPSVRSRQDFYKIARQTEAALTLKDDLGLLNERGEHVADRLEQLVRAGRPLASDAPRLTVVSNTNAAEHRVRSQAERDLLKALRMAK